jgi:hypothetical protein
MRVPRKLKKQAKKIECNWLSYCLKMGAYNMDIRKYEYKSNFFRTGLGQQLIKDIANGTTTRD